MKFQKKLEEAITSADPEWDSHWINYKMLKKYVKNKLQTSMTNSKEEVIVRTKESEFTKLVVNELRKCCNFYDTMSTQLQQRKSWIRQCLDHYERHAVNENLRPRARLLQACLNFYRDLLLIENYAIMNYCGFSKILKKHDKRSRYKIRDTFMTRFVQAQDFARYAQVLAMLAETEQMFVAIKAMESSEAEAERAAAQDRRARHQPALSPSSCGAAAAGAAAAAAAATSNHRHRPAAAGGEGPAGAPAAAPGASPAESSPSAAARAEAPAPGRAASSPAAAAAPAPSPAPATPGGSMAAGCATAGEQQLVIDALRRLNGEALKLHEEESQPSGNGTETEEAVNDLLAGQYPDVPAGSAGSLTEDGMVDSSSASSSPKSPKGPLDALASAAAAATTSKRKKRPAEPGLEDNESKLQTTGAVGKKKSKAKAKTVVNTKGK